RRNAGEAGEVLHVGSTDTVLGESLLIERDVPLGVLQQRPQPLELEAPDAIGSIPLGAKDRTILPRDRTAAPQVKQREKAPDTGVHHGTAPMIKERANIWTTYGSAHRVRSSNVTQAVGLGHSVPRRRRLPRDHRPHLPPAAVRPGYQAVLGSASAKWQRPARSGNGRGRRRHGTARTRRLVRAIGRRDGRPSGPRNRTQGRCRYRDRVARRTWRLRDRRGGTAGPGGRRRYRSLLVEQRRSHSRYPRYHPGRGLHRRRQRLSGWNASGVRSVLCPKLGTPPGAHPADPWSP